MKNKNEEKQIASKQKIWKVTAIAVVVLFVLLIAGGLIKAHYIRSSFIKPTQAQIDYTTKIATEKLQSMGINSSAFEIQAGRKMRILHENGIAKTIIQVSFYNDATTHTYLIDVNLGEILLHSETHTYGAWASHKIYDRHDSIYSKIKYER